MEKMFWHSCIMNTHDVWMLRFRKVHQARCPHLFQVDLPAVEAVHLLPAPSATVDPLNGGGLETSDESHLLGKVRNTDSSDHISGNGPSTFLVCINRSTPLVNC